jgi:hypothetical protein
MANLRGVANKKFFLFRISKLYGYPHKKSTDQKELLTAAIND